jgi:NADPH-dependent 2,4-dienoyl-CoA reductase/sulfur reductase-like enzyme
VAPEERNYYDAWGSLVESIDRSAKTVRIRNLVSGQVYDESYDKLILAPGAAPSGLSCATAGTIS